MKKTILIFAIIVLAVIAGIMVFSAYFAPENNGQNTPQENFSETGNIVINNPGLEPDAWYLVYEEEGSPAVTAKLDLSAVETDFEPGDRVEIKGYEENGIVKVSWLRVLGEPSVDEVVLYYQDSNAQGEDVCAKESLTAVTRPAPEENVIESTIKLLLKGELTQEEKAQGITTEFPLAGLELENSKLENGVLTLTFKDPNNKTVGGSCRVGVLWAQISETAKQFPDVSEVKFAPQDQLFQP